MAAVGVAPFFLTRPHPHADPSPEGGRGDGGGGGCAAFFRPERPHPLTLPLKKGEGMAAVGLRLAQPVPPDRSTDITSTLSRM